MKSLREKVQAGMTEEERCDVLFQMVNRIEENKPIGGSPEEVWLDEESGMIQYRRQGRIPNMLFCPPEVTEDPLTVIGKQQRWFTLGMHAYYMYRKTDYYTWGNTAVLAPLPVRSCIITPEDAKEIPFGRAVSALTAIDPARRVEGLKGFLLYLRERVKGMAEIHYLYNGRMVGRQTKELSEDIEDLWPRGFLISGTRYVLKNRPQRIPYRPGTHICNVEVEPVEKQGYRPQMTEGLYLYYTPKGETAAQVLYVSGGDCGNQVRLTQEQERLDICRLTGGPPAVVSKPLGHINIQRPKDYQGTAYLVNLWYSAETCCVRLQLTSESGVNIAPARSVSMKSLQ